jgi:hypothetical protein
MIKVVYTMIKEEFAYACTSYAKCKVVYDDK